MIEATLRVWVTALDDTQVDRVIAAIEQLTEAPTTVVVHEGSRREVPDA